ncbi:hemin-degrading factor [Sulfitobacter donghicola]|uniref:Hemin degrading factor n=1 Tax=Sulfitobacter donghicola DSW-25 = KCTC 12864 = JCM 14565 TaxID=1300350 RepID=A0A073ISY8_9RHOB|nr:hemin-degrading factor [Sulfitobacter donghicola]KEJ88502.1 hemin degrading factor [Sulfitobacter donghicola DSW-25 = KCTC 12864 = JCM 14565]KIN69621.1 Hemin degrading factor [Sulfitobacter donghicola DSW-25 = KCTC 12864 = JCM 14565]
MTKLSPEDIREMREFSPNLRARDFAEQNKISEAELLAAHVGQGVTQLKPHPDDIMWAAQQLGEVMALTRTLSCVHEKVGVYDNYHSGQHASMVLNGDIDLRMFPQHWQHAFAVENETEKGIQRSLQVFDAAGDAVHKIFLRDSSNSGEWQGIKDKLALQEQAQRLDVSPRQAPEAPKADPAKLDILQKEWARMTDTHQFLRLCSKLKMNRLGAYRIAGAPFVRALETSAVDQMLNLVQERGTEVMVFVGNKGCIQIHSGPIETLKPMGPWQNVMDPSFNLHLRLDHIAEVWAVEKPTQRGMAVSVEAFDKDGAIILQVFGVGREGRDSRPAWREIVKTLQGLDEEAMA